MEDIKVLLYKLIVYFCLEYYVGFFLLYYKNGMEEIEKCIGG